MPIATATRENPLPCGVGCLVSYAGVLQQRGGFGTGLVPAKTAPGASRATSREETAWPRSVQPGPFVFNATGTSIPVSGAIVVALFIPETKDPAIQDWY